MDSTRAEEADSLNLIWQEWLTVSGGLLAMPDSIRDLHNRLMSSDTEFYFINLMRPFREEMDSLHVLIREDMGIYKLAKDSLINEAMTLNAAITPSNIMESNQKLLNEIYLSTVALDSVEFDSVRVSQLYSLASQCAYTGGSAVFSARSMLSLITDIIFFDEYLCDTNYQYSGKWDGKDDAPSARATPKDTVAETLEARMYPNPANEYVVLKLNKDVPERMHLSVSDALGRSIFLSDVSFTNSLYQINTSSYQSGLYYVNLYNSQGKVFGGKLNILKR